MQALLFAALLAFSRSHVGRRPVLRARRGRAARPAGVRAVRRGPGVGAGRRDGRRCCCSRVDGRAVGSSSPSRARDGGPGRLHLGSYATRLQPLRGVLREPAPVAPGWSSAWRRSEPLVLLTLSRNRRVARVITTWTPRDPGRGRRGRRGVRLLLPRRRPDGSRRTTRSRSARSRGTSREPASLAAVAGFVLLAWKRFWRDPALLLVTAVYAFFVFYKIRIVPEHFWMARRFLPVILPSACLLLRGGAFFGVWSGASDEGSRRAGRVGGKAASRRGLVASARRSWRLSARRSPRATRPILDHVEYQGLIPRLEKLPRQFGDPGPRASSSPDVVRPARARAAARLHLREQRAGAQHAAARARAVPRLPRLGPGPVPRTSTSSAAAAPTCSRARSPWSAGLDRAVPGARVRVGAERLPAAVAAEGVRLQHLPVRGPAGRAGAVRPQRWAPTTTCTSSASTPRSGPTISPTAGRPTRRTSTLSG